MNFKSHSKSQYWDYSKNKLNPENVSYCNGKKFWFNCPDCLHSFDAVINKITKRNQWCPYCGNQRLCKDNDCEICFNKSFASHSKSEYWSNINELNPRQVFKNSGKKYWFICKECNHMFQSQIHIISNDHWCSYCSNKKLCKDNDCKICFNKSFASHSKSKYWDYNKNLLTPREVFINTHKRYWFNCEKCKHSFNNILKSINRVNSWCTYCSNIELCGKCEVCIEKSFSSHPRAKYWSNKNKLTPKQIFKYTHKKYWFNCEECNNEFLTGISNITNRDSWCPYCKHKTEKYIYKYLKKYFKVNTQVKFPWCKKKRYLPYDFVLEDHKLIIEIDGEQHFKQIMNWTTPEETQNNDIYKVSCALLNGYSILRLPQKEILENTFDWKKYIHESVNNKSIKLIIPQEFLLKYKYLKST